MAAKFFGQFLIEKKVISGLNLLRAIELQEKTNHRFGDLVLEMGLMTEDQIYSTHRAQRHEDLQFGDMAVKLGFLQVDQIKYVLEKQQQRHLYIGEALVQIGAITPEKLEVHLAEFKQTTTGNESVKIDLPADFPYREIWQVFVDMTLKMLTRIAGATFRTGNCTSTRTIPAAEIGIEVALSGSISARYILTMSNEGKKLIAASTIKKGLELSEENIEASVIKFVNIICGNAKSTLAKNNYQLSSTPATHYQNPDQTLSIPNNSLGLLFPVFLSDGEELNLILVASGE